MKTRHSLRQIPLAGHQRKQTENLMQGQKQVLEMIAAGKPLAEVLAALMRVIEAQYPEMLCSVLLLDPDGVHLRHGAGPSLPEDYTRAIDGVAIGASAGSCGTAAFRREPVVVEDITTDPLWSDFRDLALRHGLRACWSTPIFDTRGAVLGTFAMYYRQPGRPTAHHHWIIDVATQSAAIAINLHTVQTALRVSEVRFRALTELSSDLYWETDAEHRISQYTYGAKIHPVVPANQLMGQRRWEIREYVYPDEEGWRAHRATLDAHLPFRDFEAASRGVDGKVRHFALSGEPVFDASGAFTGYRGVGREITEQKAAEARLDQLAHYDTLTNLPNRALFHDRLRQAMARADRGQTLLAVMFLDLDGFKEINDSLGHAAGDEVLKETARRLQSCLRSTDTVGRLGGDEFTVLLEDVHHVDEVSTLARKILDTFAEQAEVAGHELHLSMSIGITVYPLDGQDADTLLKNADIAMYQAKQEGRNNLQFYAKELGARTERRADLRLRLHHALERGEFALHYQPQVALAGGGIFGVEALLRWNDAELGPVSPGQFIPVAEEMGLIVPIGDWVLREACRQCKSWLDAGLGPLRVAVNLSPRQFRQKKLAQRIGEILRETGLPAACLEIETTEGMVMKHAERAITTLTELNRVGVQIAIDDFGTGYSSLAYLQRFPVHVLKIDQSFVQAIHGDTEEAAIVNTVIQLAKLLGLKALAEGVETAEQREYLRAHGCDAFQGYLFCKPQPAERIGELLAADCRERAAAQLYKRAGS